MVTEEARAHADRTASGFDPSRFLTDVSGEPYLETKWRLLWLRTAHPDAAIETELVSHDGQLAIFRARVAIPDTIDPTSGVILARGGSATGWGSEQDNDFRDYIEKAETKALGRALAALGFGTQFCEGDGVSAAGSDRASGAPKRGSQRPVQGARRREAALISDRQCEYVRQLWRGIGQEDEQLGPWIAGNYGGRSLPELSKQEASALIEHLKGERGGQGGT